MADAIVADVNSSGIYQIRNVVNGKRYIGSAVCFRNRWASHRSHLRKGKHSSSHLQNAWNKWGEEFFAFEVIEICNAQQLIEREQSWFDSVRPEYNISPTAGSPLGVRHSDEFKRKVSERFKGKKLGQEQVDRLRLAAKRNWLDPAIRSRISNGIKQSYDDELRAFRSKQSFERWADKNYRSSMSEKIKASFDEDRRKLTSEQSRLRWSDPGYRERVCAAMLGKEISQQAREKIRASLTGRTMTVETRKKKSALSDAEVLEIRRLHGEGETNRALAGLFSVSSTTISRVCTGKRYGWIDIDNVCESV